MMVRIRNRYYEGKLLKYEDFQIEQEYFESQLRSIRSSYFGMGILNGLGIKHKSGAKFLLQKGSAIDSEGHLIEVSKDVLLDIREIEGFHKLIHEEGYLILTYAEHKQRNLIEETYRIQLSPTLCDDITYDSFFHNKTVYQEHGIKIEIFIPAMVSDDGYMQFSIHIHNQDKAVFQLSMDFHCGHFELQEHQQHIHIISPIDTNKHEYFFEIKHLDHTKGKKVNFIFDHILLAFDGKTVPLDDIHIHSLLHSNLMNEIRNTLYKQTKQVKQNLCLGYVKFEKNEETIITEIKEKPSAYSYRPCLYHKRDEILQHYGMHTKALESNVFSNTLSRNTGMYRFLIHEDDTLYVSEEIVHGLGIGNVYIQAGICNKEDQDFEICFGNHTLFHDTKPEVEFAIRIWKERGTFQIALRLPVYHNIEYLDVIWYAQLYPTLPQMDAKPQLLRLRPSAVTLEPFASCIFTPEYSNEIKTNDIQYRICDEHGGTIDEEGLYYAPEIAGIYQIEAQYQNDRVYAYVKVVKKE